MLDRFLVSFWLLYKSVQNIPVLSNKFCTNCVLSIIHHLINVFLPLFCVFQGRIQSQIVLFLTFSFSIRTKAGLVFSHEVFHNFIRLVYTKSFIFGFLFFLDQLSSFGLLSDSHWLNYFFYWHLQTWAYHWLVKAWKYKIPFLLFLFSHLRPSCKANESYTYRSDTIFIWLCFNELCLSENFIWNRWGIEGNLMSSTLNFYLCRLLNSKSTLWVICFHLCITLVLRNWDLCFILAPAFSSQFSPSIYSIDFPGEVLSKFPQTQWQLLHYGRFH